MQCPHKAPPRTASLSKHHRVILCVPVPSSTGGTAMAHVRPLLLLVLAFAAAFVTGASCQQCSSATHTGIFALRDHIAQAQVDPACCTVQLTRRGR